jgi:hypothetical protein
MAAELNILPHEALLLGVRISAARVADVELRREAVLAERGGQVEHPAVLRLNEESRRERTLMWKASKAAVDAGVAEKLVRSIEMESAIIVRTLGRAVDRMNLSQADRVRIHGIIHEELLRIEASPDDLVQPAIEAPSGGHRPITPEPRPGETTPLHSRSQSNEGASGRGQDADIDQPREAGPEPARDGAPGGVEEAQPPEPGTTTPPAEEGATPPVRVVRNPDGSTTTSGTWG